MRIAAVVSIPVWIWKKKAGCTQAARATKPQPTMGRCRTLVSRHRDRPAAREAHRRQGEHAGNEGADREYLPGCQAGQGADDRDPEHVEQARAAKRLRPAGVPGQPPTGQQVVGVAAECEGVVQGVTGAPASAAARPSRTSRTTITRRLAPIVSHAARAEPPCAGVARGSGGRSVHGGVLPPWRQGRNPPQRTHSAGLPPLRLCHAAQVKPSGQRATS